MVKNDRSRHLPAIPHRQVMQPPQRLPTRPAHEWINIQTEEKALQAIQQGAIGALGVQVNTAMAVTNADTTVRGMNAMEGMREQGGTPRHQQRVNNVLATFQEDMVDANRGITAVAAENILQAINEPFRHPVPEKKQSFLDKLLGEETD